MTPRSAPPRRPLTDTGSMPIALLLTLVGISLSALLVPMALGQLQSTRFAQDRSGALHAAQAGLDVALGQIRAARTVASPSSGATYDTGRRDRLPCGPLSAGVPGGGRYLVELNYLTADPSGLLSAADPYAAVAASPDRITTCVAGAGTPVTPAYAVLFAWGTGRPTGAVRDAPASRRLQAMYRFRTTNENIPGGLIRVRGGSGVELCLDAGSALPAAGARVFMQPCQDRNARQVFTYNRNLTLTLSSSRTASTPQGMCLQAGTTHTVGTPVDFQPCAATTSVAQQWSTNNVANFMGTTDGVSLDGFCFNVQTPDTPGSPVVLASGYPDCEGVYDNKQTFLPDAAVGAGAAGVDAGQVVNFKLFGRCLDVTNNDPTQTYLIAWPCKQAPDTSHVLWNQKWQLPAVSTDPADPRTPSGTGAIITRYNGVDHCLESPGSTAFGSYPRVVPCPSGTPTGNLVWTVYGKTGAYATSYQIQAGPKPAPGGAGGICLAAADPTAQPAELYENTGYNGPPIGKIVMRDCDGSTWQKWNAPADLLDSAPLKNFGEK